MELKVKTPKFVIGDIVHIPQNVLLWGATGSAKTKKPTTGVVLMNYQIRWLFLFMVAE